MPTRNPYPAVLLWRGSLYNDSAYPLYRALILGENPDKDGDVGDPHWIEYWIKQCALEERPYKDENIDRTFSRLYKFERNLTATYLQAYKSASLAKLLAWFEQIAFFNFIPHAIAKPKNARIKKNGRAAARIF
jgi:hypothetical protein